MIEYIDFIQAVVNSGITLKNALFQHKAHENWHVNRAVAGLRPAYGLDIAVNFGKCGLSGTSSQHRLSSVVCMAH